MSHGKLQVHLRGTMLQGLFSLACNRFIQSSSHRGREGTIAMMPAEADNTRVKISADRDPVTGEWFSAKDRVRNAAWNED